MTTYKIIDTDTGQSIKMFRQASTALKEADAMNERIDVGEHAFNERFTVREYGASPNPTTAFCRYCDDEVSIQDLDLHGYCPNCIPFPQHHKAVS